MRVLLADPPAFTPWYDHQLAAGLARAGADVELLTSHFRFGDVPPPDGYRVHRRFYPLSSRLFKRSRARLPLKAVEHVGVMASLAAAHPDVVHVQWLALPQADVHLRFRSPAVFTAHDLLPRRTAGKRDLWQRLLERFDRVVVHSERGRETLAELGIDARVIPHPVYPSAATRADDGRTLLSLGVIRPYKGLPDAIEVTRRIPEARLVVAGDPAMPLDDLPRRRAGRVAARLPPPVGARPPPVGGDRGGVPVPRRARPVGRAPAGARSRRARPSSTTSPVSASRSARSAPGAVVPAGDVDAFTAAVQALLGDADALARARAGADAARRELTWDAAAAAHLDLYRELA